MKKEIINTIETNANLQLKICISIKISQETLRRWLRVNAQQLTLFYLLKIVSNELDIPIENLIN